MKKLFYLLFVLSLTLFVGCKNDSDGGDQPIPSGDTLWYEFTKVEEYAAKEYVEKFHSDIFYTSADSAKFMNSINPDLRVRLFSTNYHSLYIDGNTITVSGLIAVPFENGKFTATDLVIDNRSSQFNNDEAPSNKPNYGAAFVATNRVVVQADLIGLGASVDKPLNYCCYKLASRNTIDLALVADQIIHSTWLNTGVSADKHLTTYNEGFSQGGYTALAFHKYYETEATDDEKKCLPLVKSWCGGGPYNTQTLMDAANNQQAYVFPAFHIIGMYSGMKYYPEYFGDLTLRDFFADGIPDEKVATFESMVESKKTSGTALTFLFEKEVMEEIPNPTHITKIVNKDCYISGTKERNAIEAYCRKECLLDGWIPKLPITFYTAKDDDVILLPVFEEVKQKFGTPSNITYICEEGVKPALPIVIPGYENGIAVHANAEKSFNTQVLLGTMK